MQRTVTRDKLPARRLIIPVFIGNRDCPNRCIFCRENSGEDSLAGKNAEDALREIVFKYLGAAGSEKKSSVHIAFYGGNFTGLDPDRQKELLSLAGAYVDKGLAQSLRISTRPDALARDEIELLKSFPVRTVELGVQSMSDEVLSRSRRGHSSSDVERAVSALKENGFETGIHMMAGLPGDSREGFLQSVDRVISLRPDMVRIHPTLVFHGTQLADLYRSGAYVPLSMDEAVDLCAQALIRFERAGISVIRLGLQPTDFIERTLIAGPYHPAFRSLVEGETFFAMASRLFASAPLTTGSAVFHVSPPDGSFFRGLNSRNMEKLKALAFPLRIILKEDPGQQKGSVKLKTGGMCLVADRLSDTIQAMKALEG